MIEHKNTILAVVLSLLVIVGWQYFIGYPQMERQRQEAQLKQPAQPGGAQPGAAQPGAPAPNAAQPATPEVPGTPKAGAPSAQTQTLRRIARRWLYVKVKWPEPICAPLPSSLGAHYYRQASAKAKPLHNFSA